MTPHQDPQDAARDAGARGFADELYEWANERGALYQAARDMVVVHGAVNEHHHEHYHSAGRRTSRTTTPSVNDDSPYPGLRSFDADEAEWFFGREALVHRVMERLELSMADHRPLAVVAPSGAGKSSVLRAGVLPGLAQGRLPGSRHWPQLLLTPTAEPLAALTSGLARLTGVEPAVIAEAMEAGPGRLAAVVRGRLGLRPDHRLVLVVDQLEEVFTLCQDASVRRRFLDVLAGLTGSEASGDEPPVALTVYGVRADFYGACSAFPHLREALLERQVIVGPMSEDEVRRAVTSPAERDRLTVTPEFVDTVLRDLRGTTPRDEGAYEAGRLPLLAHALRATWLERRGDALTVDSYHDTGGIDGAVAATAEEEYGKLTAAEQRAARLMFLGLVRIGENGEVTRRRRSRTDLLLAAADPRAVPDLTERFTRARLLTQGVDWREGTVTVEVTHEALLRAWPRLSRDWIGAGQSGVPVRQEVEEAAVAWERGDRKDVSALLRGARLEWANTWASVAGPEDLTPLVDDFLAASARQERRSRRFRRGAVAVVAVLAVLASGLAAYAFDQGREAVQARDDAIFDRVSAEAERQRETNGALAAQLDLVAHRMRPTDRLRTRLTTAANSLLPAALPGDFGSAPPVAYHRTGRLATGGPSLRFWDTEDTARPARIASEPAAGEGVAASAVAYSPRGDVVARGDGNGEVRLLDVSDAKRPVALSTPFAAARGTVVALQFSPDGRTLAVADSGAAGHATSGAVSLLDVSDPRRPRRASTVVSVERQGITSVAFSPDGRTLAVTGGTGFGNERRLLVRLWNVSDPTSPKALGGDLGGHAGIVHRAAFSPVGSVLVTAGGDSRVLVRDVSDPLRPKVTNTLYLGTPLSSLAFSPGGHMLATGETSGSINLWNIGAPSLTRSIVPTLRAHSSTVSHIAFDPTGRTLASGGGDGRILLWRIPTGLIVMGGGEAAMALALSGDGRLLAVGSGPYVTLFDFSDTRRLSHVGGLGARFRGAVTSLAFRPRPPGSSGRAGGVVLATGDRGGDVRLWDVSSTTRPVEIGTALAGQTQPVSALAFDAGGSTLVATSMELQGGYVGGLRAWDLADPARPVALGGELHAERVAIPAVVAAPRPGHLYTSDVFGRFRVWRTGEGTVPSIAGRASGNQVIITLAAHPRAPLLAAGGGDSRIRLWDMSRQAAPKAFGRPMSIGGSVWSIAFAPDGAMLAGGDAIGQIRQWDTSDPGRATPYGLSLTGHGSTVLALRYAPRGGALLSAGQDGTVRLWQTDPAAAKASLCAATSSAMTPAVWKEFVSPALPYDPPCGT